MRCLFCDDPDGKRSNEHVLRKEFKKHFPYQPNIGHTTWDKNWTKSPEALRPISPFDVQVNAVCKECNEGWLETLENDVLPMLLAFGRLRSPSSLTGEEVDMLRLWAATRALLRTHTETADSGGRASVDLFHHVYQTRTPPPGTAVGIGVIDMWGVRAAGLHTYGSLVEMIPGQLDVVRLAQERNRVHAVSFGVGHFFFQTVVPGGSVASQEMAGAVLNWGRDLYPRQFHELVASSPLHGIGKWVLLTRRQAEIISGALAVAVGETPVDDYNAPIPPEAWGR